MRFHTVLERPAVYRVKSRLLSLGRRSVFRYLEAIAAAAPPGPVLDVACGPGEHVGAFSQPVFAVDTNRRYLEYAARHHAARFGVMDATRMAFGGEAFALVFAVGLCHHLADDAVRAVAREMRRVVRPGGRAVIVEGVYPPYRLHPGTWLFRLDRGAHTRTRASITALVESEGFSPAVRNLPGSFPYHRAVFAFEKPVAGVKTL